MEKYGRISLVAAGGGSTLCLDLNYNGSEMPAFFVVEGEDTLHWQLNPDSVVGILNLLNDSMIHMMRTMAINLYNKSPDTPITIIRPTDADNVIPFRST